MEQQLVTSTSNKEKRIVIILQLCRLTIWRKNIWGSKLIDLFATYTYTSRPFHNIRKITSQQGHWMKIFRCKKFTVFLLARERRERAGEREVIFKWHCQGEFLGLRTSKPQDSHMQQNDWHVQKKTYINKGTWIEKLKKRILEKINQ